MISLPSTKTQRPKIFSNQKIVPFERAFTDNFLEQYANRLCRYFSDKRVKFHRSDVLTPRNRNIVYTWAKKLKTAKAEEHPLPIRNESDVNNYKNVSYWIQVLNTLLASSDLKKVNIYTQTTNGLFRYVESGRYHADLRAEALYASNVNWYNLKDFSLDDYASVIGLFIILLHEHVKKIKMPRTENFYKYLGMFDFDEGFPIFRRGLIENSQEFRAILIKFRKFYNALIEQYDLPDTMEYDAMLEFSGKFPSVSTADKIFDNFSPNDLRTFKNHFAAFILE